MKLKCEYSFARMNKQGGYDYGVHHECIFESEATYYYWWASYSKDGLIPLVWKLERYEGNERGLIK